MFGFRAKVLENQATANGRIAELSFRVGVLADEAGNNGRRLFEQLEKVEQELDTVANRLAIFAAAADGSKREILAEVVAARASADDIYQLLSVVSNEGCGACPIGEEQPEADGLDDELPGRDRWSVRLTHNARRNRYEAWMDGRRVFGISPSLVWSIERKFRICPGYVCSNGVQPRQGDLFYVEFDYSESRRARR